MAGSPQIHTKATTQRTARSVQIPGHRPPAGHVFLRDVPAMAAQTVIDGKPIKIEYTYLNLLVRRGKLKGAKKLSAPKPKPAKSSRARQLANMVSRNAPRWTVPIRTAQGLISSWAERVSAPTVARERGLVAQVEVAQQLKHMNVHLRARLNRLPRTRLGGSIYLPAESVARLQEDHQNLCRSVAVRPLARKTGLGKKVIRGRIDSGLLKTVEVLRRKRILARESIEALDAEIDSLLNTLKKTRKRGFPGGKPAYDKRLRALNGEISNLRSIRRALDAIEHPNAPERRVVSSSKATSTTLGATALRSPLSAQELAAQRSRLEEKRALLAQLSATIAQRESESRRLSEERQRAMTEADLSAEHLPNEIRAKINAANAVAMELTTLRSDYEALAREIKRTGTK